MNCQEFEREWTDLEDHAQFTDDMRSHRLVCRRCAEMLEDVLYLREQARRMELVEPPDRLWPLIRQQLEQEGIIREPRPRWFPAPALAGTWFRLPMGLAYAAVFVVSFVVLYLYSLLTSTPPVPPTLAVTPQVPEMALTQTASPERDRKVQELIERVSPEHRATFVSSWNQMNSSIEQLEMFRRANPGDPFMRDQLISAYQQREHLWETFVRLEELQ